MAELTPLIEALTQAMSDCVSDRVIERLTLLLSEIVTREPIPEVFDKKSLAAYLKVSESTISKLVSNKQIPHFKVAQGQSGSVRFHRRDVDKWILKNTIPALNDISEKHRVTLRAATR